MQQAREHTLKAFDEDLERLRALISQMGGFAEHAIGEAMRCLVQRDIEGAAKVVEGDKKLDVLEVETERQAVQLIALRAPMASDLRDVVAALKISGVVERIGDYAKNIAKRVPLLENMERTNPCRCFRKWRGLRPKWCTMSSMHFWNAIPKPPCVCANAICGRRFLRFDLPDAAHAHDGKSTIDRTVGAPPVRRQEPGAGRRPCDQYRGNDLLCRDRGPHDRSPR